MSHHLDRALCAVLLGLVTACGGSGGEEGAESPTPAAATVSLATTGGDFRSPRDTTPGVGGQTLFFVADNDQGSGVFQVPADGGIAQPLSIGGGFTRPEGIAASEDGAHLYVADPEAEGGLGAIFRVNTEDGSADLMEASVGRRPIALSLRPGVLKDLIVFTGMSDAQVPEVYELDTESGEVEVMATGDPLSLPAGVALDENGRVYIADQTAAGDGMGRIFRMENGAITTLVEEVMTGDPAGLALTLDGLTLLVSAIDHEEGTDMVLIVNTQTGESRPFTDVVGENTEGGGIHRAPDVDVFGWADWKAGVYKVTPN